MGLDWCLRPKLRDPAYADEVEVLEKMLDEWYEKEEGTEDEKKNIKASLRKLQIAPLVYLGAKQVDRDDPESVEAFRATVQSHLDGIAKDKPDNQNYVSYWQKPFETLLDENIGSILVDTIPKENEEKIASNRGNPFVFLCGHESFRGKRIASGGLIGRKLSDECYKDHDPEEMLDFADRLEAEIDRKYLNRLMPAYKRSTEISHSNLFADKAKPGHEDEYAELSEKLDDKFWQMLAVAEGVEWLRFWAKAGFSMRGDY
jgi:hypothetical protein